MIISSDTLNSLRTGFNATFQGKLKATTSMWPRVATRVPSSTKSNTYGWMKNLPGMREWIGPRHVMAISEASYTIVNKPYEQTVGVDRYDIEDDNIGVYAPMFEAMGEGVAAHPDILVWTGAVAAGFATDCWDGQSFFDTDHPILNDDGETTGTFANTDGGAGTPWFLLCTRKAIKPFLFQERQAPQFVAMDDPTNPNVFMNREFVYGTDARWNVGYSFPQLAWGSKQTLNKDNYKNAREALMSMKGDGGRPLGLTPDLLVFPPNLEGEALEILNAERDANGATNVYKGTAELLNCPWLA